MRNGSFDEKYISDWSDRRGIVSLRGTDTRSGHRADREREKSGEKEERSDDVWSRKFDRALNLISVPGRRLN